MLRLLRSTALWILLLPYAATFIGAALNQLVLLANHGRFPVAWNSARLAGLDQSTLVVGNDGVVMLDNVHCIMTSKTHLNFFADILDFGDGIYSIGDELLKLGGWFDTFCIYCWICVVVPRLRRP